MYGGRRTLLEKKRRFRLKIDEELKKKYDKSMAMNIKIYPTYVISNFHLLPMIPYICTPETSVARALLVYDGSSNTIGIPILAPRLHMKKDREARKRLVELNDLSDYIENALVHETLHGVFHSIGEIESVWRLDVIDDDAIKCVRWYTPDDYAWKDAEYYKDDTSKST
jgi:hypothetical protein